MEMLDVYNDNGRKTGKVVGRNKLDMWTKHYQKYYYCYLDGCTLFNNKNNN